MVIMCNGTPFTQASIKKSASNQIRTQARKREEIIMWIWVNKTSFREKIQTGPDSSKRPLDYKLSAHTEYSDRVVGLSYSSRETITY